KQGGGNYYIVCKTVPAYDGKDYRHRDGGPYPVPDMGGTYGDIYFRGRTGHRGTSCRTGNGHKWQPKAASHPGRNVSPGNAACGTNCGDVFILFPWGLFNL